MEMETHKGEKMIDDLSGFGFGVWGSDFFCFVSGLGGSVRFTIHRETWTLGLLMLVYAYYQDTGIH